MTRISGQTSQATLRYQEELANAARQSEQPTAAPTARARSRTFGFSLGKLGVEFTTETLDLDQESIRKAACQSDPKARDFDVECEVAALRSTTGRNYGPDRNPGQASSVTSMLTRQALNAYEATANLPDTPLPVMFTATA